MTYRLMFNDAVNIWLRHWAGEYQHTIAASYDVNRARVNDVLNERLHTGSKAVAATNGLRSRKTAVRASGSWAERGLWPNVRFWRIVLQNYFARPSA